MILTMKTDSLYSEEEKYFDYTDKLDKITAKTLVLVGDRDWICPIGTGFCSSHQDILMEF